MAPNDAPAATWKAGQAHGPTVRDTVDVKTVAQFRRDKRFQRVVRLVGSLVGVPPEPTSDTMYVDVHRQKLSAERIDKNAFGDLVRYPRQSSQEFLGVLIIPIA